MLCKTNWMKWTMMQYFFIFNVFAKMSYPFGLSLVVFLLINDMKWISFVILCRFVAMKRKNGNLKELQIEYKLYRFVQFWQKKSSANRKLRFLQSKQYEQCEQNLIERAFKILIITFSNIIKSKKFRNRSLNAKCIKIWKKQCVLKQIEMNHKVQQIKLMMIQCFWIKWNRVLSHRQHLFNIAISCRERMQFNLMRECYMEWNIQLTLQSKCKHIMERNVQRNTLIIFQSWFHDSFSAQINRKALKHYTSKLRVLACL